MPMRRPPSVTSLRVVPALPAFRYGSGFQRGPPRSSRSCSIIDAALMAAVLVIALLCEPSSELHIAEDWYRRTALEDLLGLPTGRVDDARLYRALDRLLPHKEATERRLTSKAFSWKRLQHFSEAPGKESCLGAELGAEDVAAGIADAIPAANCSASRTTCLDFRSMSGDLRSSVYSSWSQTGFS